MIISMDADKIRRNIPQELLNEKRWVIRGKNGPEDKAPYQAKNGRLASKTNPEDWASFEEAVAAVERFKMAGVGFVVSPPFIGFDIDACIVDGTIKPFAWEIIEKIDSYAEVSPSGTGVHIIALGAKPSWAGTKINNVDGQGARLELYDCQYLTVTGDVL